eukprot:gnl/Spiro4/10848_TR5776_c0_g1_i1.p1 gnl/Spiro4/10848_TR5776_c0_g1~~gnl/Spiro4/10848_TR5776_c0_g1_i1.p1  ORF type:complete len:297 (+),score=11.71 gnl/Spiro4/10848_TR5776_c0_g1_i1:38-928(+)
MNILSLLIGIGLVLGGFACWIPQYISIVKQRSSDGLSYWTLLITNVSQVACVINAFLLNNVALDSCLNDFFDDTCIAPLLTVSQVTALWLICFPLMFFYIGYYNRVPEDRRSPGRYRMAVAVLISMLLTTTALSICAVVFVHKEGWNGASTTYYAWFLGIASAIMTCIQWTPQIFDTWVSGERGCVSMLTLAISAPGSLLTTYFMIFVSSQSISTWMCYFISALQQFLLLYLLWRCPEHLPIKEGLLEPVFVEGADPDHARLHIMKSPRFRMDSDQSATELQTPGEEDALIDFTRQ